MFSNIGEEIELFFIRSSCIAVGCNPFDPSIEDSFLNGFGSYPQKSKKSF